MNLVTFLLLLVLFVFFGIVGVRSFRVSSKRFWAIAIIVLLATAILYLLTYLCLEKRHPSIFLLLLFLVVGIGVYLSARYFSR